MKPAAYMCVGIDCECDKDRRWHTQLPLVFRGVSSGIGERLQPLFAKLRARPTYLLSPEVMRDEPSVKLLRSFGDACELGAHMHTEFIDAGAQPVVTSAFQRDDAPPEELRKMTVLTAQFTQTFGFRPTSFRAGRFGIGPASLGILADLKYTVDSSVTPYMNWASAGAPGLAYRDAPTQPYRPDPYRPGKAGGSALVEIPLTIRPHKLSRVPGFGWLAPRWLRPTRANAATLVQLARDELQAARALDGPAVLNVMFHNVEVVAGASPYAAGEGAAARILNALQGLLEFCRDQSIPVVGLSEIPDLVPRLKSIPLRLTPTSNAQH